MSNFILISTILTCDQFIVAQNSNLTNEDNSCWFDSTIQALSSSGKLNTQLNADDYDKKSIPRLYIKLNEKMRNNYESVKKFSRDEKIEDDITIKDFHFMTAKAIDPSESKTSQKDSDEFFIKILNCFVNDSEQYKKLRNLFDDRISSVLEKALYSVLSPKAIQNAKDEVEKLKDSQRTDSKIYVIYKQKFLKSILKNLAIDKSYILGKIQENSWTVFDHYLGLGGINPNFLPELSQKYAKKNVIGSQLKDEINEYLKEKSAQLNKAKKDVEVNKIVIEDYQLINRSGNKTSRFTPVANAKYICEETIKNVLLQHSKRELQKVFNVKSGTFFKQSEVSKYLEKISKMSDAMALVANQTSKCTECGTEKNKKEKDSILKINIPNDKNTLDYCIDCYFNEKEASSGTVNIETSECLKCGKNTKHEKQILISKSPEVLILQLVRFKLDDSGATKKNESPITFDMDLKLDQFFSDQLKPKLQNLKYKLVSFVVHSGSRNSGHYWAYGKDLNGDWFRYDDMQPKVPNVNDHISKILNEGIDVTHWDHEGTPYILIYELVSPQEELKQDVINLKSRLNELKTKLQVLSGKLGILKGKL
ncbi:MAG: hypothetical protein V1646_04840 [bacterium]